MASFGARNYTGTKLQASADMRSRSKATSIKTERSARSKRQGRDVVLCLRNAGYEVSLERRKFYEMIPDQDAAEHGQLRVIDESGEDYLFPTSYFAIITLPDTIRNALLAS